MTSEIRLATAADEEEVFAICKELHVENALFEISEPKVRGMLRKAFDKQGGIIGLIGPPGKVEAVMFLLISGFWYSDEYHLEELFSFCRPQYRKSAHAKTLVAWAKHMADELHLKLVTGILSTERTAAKVRLYRMQLGDPTGAFFVHNGAEPLPRKIDPPCQIHQWMDEVSIEYNRQGGKQWSGTGKVTHTPTGMSEKFKIRWDDASDREKAIKDLAKRVDEKKKNGQYDEIVRNAQRISAATKRAS